MRQSCSEYRIDGSGAANAVKGYPRAKTAPILSLLSKGQALCAMERLGKPSLLDLQLIICVLYTLLMLYAWASRLRLVPPMAVSPGLLAANWRRSGFDMSLQEAARAQKQLPRQYGLIICHYYSLPGNAVDTSGVLIFYLVPPQMQRSRLFGTWDLIRVGGR